MKEKEEKGSENKKVNPFGEISNSKLVIEAKKFDFIQQTST